MVFGLKSRKLGLGSPLWGNLEGQVRLMQIRPKFFYKTSFFNTFWPILAVFGQESRKLGFGAKSGVQVRTKKIVENIIFDLFLVVFGQKSRKLGFWQWTMRKVKGHLVLRHIGRTGFSYVGALGTFYCGALIEQAWLSSTQDGCRLKHLSRVSGIELSSRANISGE